MTDPDDADREILTWELFGEATRDLARSVADADFRADLVLSVARGGLTVGGALAYALSVKNCATINVEFYTGVDERLPVPVVLPPVLNPVDVTGLKVLVADDVADSGRTLELVRKVVDEHVAEVRTVVLYQKPQSVIDADFVWRRTDRWINFPWSSQAPIVGPRGVDA